MYDKKQENGHDFHFVQYFCLHSMLNSQMSSSFEKRVYSTFFMEWGGGWGGGSSIVITLFTGGGGGGEATIFFFTPGGMKNVLHDMDIIFLQPWWINKSIFSLFRQINSLVNLCF